MTSITLPDQFSFWVFLIPGFILVWSFRYFTNLDKRGDFEFAGLSVVCGLLNLALYGLLVNYRILKWIPIADLYSATLVLSAISFFTGLFSAQISKNDWVRNFINFLKSKWF